MLNKLFRRGQKPTSSDPFDLSRTVLSLSKKDHWTIADACEGVQIIGGTGSGKTSGSGNTIRKAMLTGGWGGLVLTAKKDETAEWIQACHNAGRSDDLIIFSPASGQRFNFMEYESRRPGAGGGLTLNLINLFRNVLEVGEAGQEQGGRDESPFWGKALNGLLRNAIDLCLMATGKVTLPDLNAIIDSAPQSPEQMHDPAWQSSSTCMQMLEQADEKAVTSLQRNDYDQTATYWLRRFPTLAERTRSIIVIMFVNMADCFLRGDLYELFCTRTTVVPEHTHMGKIIIIDLPVKEWDEVGRYAQVVWKYLWQRATERRDFNLSKRPVFLWADESQNFITRHDMQFQTTARSSKASTIYLTQNLPNYHAVLGGPNNGYADSLLGCLNTKIIHNNADPSTLEWAEKLMGKSWQSRSSSNTTTGQHNQPGSMSVGSSQSLDPNIIAEKFTQLRTGGPQNKWCVDAYLYQSGRVWHATKAPYIPVTFAQGV